MRHGLESRLKGLILGAYALVGACSGDVTSTPKAEAAAPASTETSLVIDPACLANVAWFSERESGDIQLSGCRAQALIPAKEEDGSRRYDSDDGAWIITRNEKTASDGKVSFEVIYNGGGSLSGKYQVTGTPDDDGLLKVGQFTIVPLS